MTFQELEQDLFTVEEGYLLAHCISADAKMGAGIAVAFCQHFDLNSLREQASSKPLDVGSCYRVGRVLNLVTKPKYWQKPSYATLTAALEDMRNQCVQAGIDKIAMPRIGCGLDRLRWDKTRQIIQEVFEETDIDILVCSL